MIKVSDYIVKYLEARGIDTCFCITGGAAAHLMESVRTSNIKVYYNYNEQACAMAGEGYARISKKPALVLVTNGPGSTNTLTGVMGAWQDGIPMIILSGQVPRRQTIGYQNVSLRQVGVQECDIIKMVSTCTNYSEQLSDVNSIRDKLDLAWEKATTNRMGPVWLDIPIDLQSEMIEVDDFTFEKHTVPPLKLNNQLFRSIFAKANKPLIVAGNGIHLANAEHEFHNLVKQLNIPVICTWNATDLFDYNDPLYIGNFGILGERVANLAVQNADLLLILGTRLSIPCIGYNTEKFSPHSVKIMIDVDENEMCKSTLNIDYKVHGDLKSVIPQLDLNKVNCDEWKNKLQKFKLRYNVYNEPHMREDNFVNSFDFMKELGNCLLPYDTVVTDMGTSFTCTMQSLRSNGLNRLFTSSALCSMGYGLPGSIGAHIANSTNRVICIAGDGGIQMNIQELQTIAHNKLPIKIILLNNGGLLAISLMQDNLFNKNRFGADPGSGVSNPDFIALAGAYGIPAHKLTNLDNVKEKLNDLLNIDGPILIEVNMVRNQLLIPRVQSKKDDSGKIISGSLESMYPFIKEEF